MRAAIAAVVGVVFFSAVQPAQATPITWQFAGNVTGFQCLISDCADAGALAGAVPLGTPVNVFVTFDLAGPPNPSIPCLLALTTATLEIAGVSYVHGGYLFENAFGFGSAQCDPGSNRVEVVVPFWFEGGPQLPNGWTPFGGNPLPGLFWPGPLTMNPDKPIGSSFGYFSAPGHSPQRFTANLVPVPEPSTVALLGIGTALCVATLRRRRAG